MPHAGVDIPIRGTVTMVADRKGRGWSDVLIREATDAFRFLVEDHGFRQHNHAGEAYAQVEFQGDRLTLILTFEGREFEFHPEIKYHKFPRKNPKFLWTVCEALGISSGPIVTESMVGENRLRELVVETARLIADHWDVIDHDPSQELFEKVKKIEDRYARRVR